LVHHIVRQEELEARATELAWSLSRLSPEAVRLGMDYVHRARGMNPQEAVELADTMRRRMFHSADFAEGVRSFFAKREPEWPSIRPAAATEDR
jgi:enoyl-CoA hydratase/carnithine racemase